jgi:tRNA A-37 threonylcarbamoyl transferase component Bud32
MVPPAQCKSWKEGDFYYKKLRKTSQYNFIKHNFDKMKNHSNILEINFLNDNVISTRNLKGCKKWDRNYTSCRSLASVIKTLNSLGLSHGDLMPKNLLMQDGNLKVIDFELLFPDVCSLDHSVDLVGLPSMHYNLNSFEKPVIVSSKAAFGNTQHSFMFHSNIKML